MSVSLAHLAIVRFEQTGQVSTDELAAIPQIQWRIWFSELSAICPARLNVGIERRRANALNVEIGQPAARCSFLSPDNMGLRWLYSGGSALAYGCCEQNKCKYIRPIDTIIRPEWMG